MKREHILIIRFSALGDVAMAVPVVYSLAIAYPQLRITVLSRPQARTFFEDLAPNVGFMEADIDGEYHGVRGLNTLFRRLVAKQFTAVADFHGVLRSSYLRFRFNIARCHVAHIDKHRRGKRQLTNLHHKVLQPQPTSFDNYADVLRQLGYPIEINFQSIFPPEGGNLNLLPAIIGPKKSFEQWIGIAPTAAHEGKVYPYQRMKKVIWGLLRDFPKARIFLFGRGQAEDELFETWCTEIDACVHVARHLETMHQELILMSHLDAMVSMDSANMHLASLTATPVVSLWGATHPYAGFVGWGQDPDNCIQLTDIPCRPCSIFGNKPCERGDFACLQIEPEEIIKRVGKVIIKN